MFEIYGYRSDIGSGGSGIFAGSSILNTKSRAGDLKNTGLTYEISLSTFLNCSRTFSTTL